MTRIIYFKIEDNLENTIKNMEYEISRLTNGASESYKIHVQRTCRFEPDQIGAIVSVTSTNGSRYYSDAYYFIGLKGTSGS